MIKDAHNALLDIQSSGRAKELLGQGLLMRNMQERNAEQEKIEKRRQVSPEVLMKVKEQTLCHVVQDLTALSKPLTSIIGSIPHAHQPGAAGVCVPGISYAFGNPLHGRP